MYSELESHSPEHIDAFFAALRPVFDVCVAEHECLYFDIVQDPEQPGTICWVEHVDGLVGSFTNVSSRAPSGQMGGQRADVRRETLGPTEWSPQSITRVENISIEN